MNTNDDNDEGKETKESLASNQGGTETDLFSGALTTIGNHVASFSSIIGKLATLKLHQAEENSHTLFGKITTSNPEAINLSIGENEEFRRTNRQNSSKKIMQIIFAYFSYFSEVDKYKLFQIFSSILIDFFLSFTKLRVSDSTLNNICHLHRESFVENQNNCICIL